MDVVKVTKWLALPSALVAAYVKELEYNKKPVPIEFMNMLMSLELPVKKFERHIFKLRDGG